MGAHSFASSGDVAHGYGQKHHIFPLPLAHWAVPPSTKPTRGDLHDRAEKLHRPNFFPGVDEGNVSPAICLLFLPHGVRILAMYFYGWKTIFYIMPASYLFLALSNYTGSGLDPLAPIISIVACYLGYTGSAFVLRQEEKQLSIRKWKFFIIVGVTSSLANGLSLSLLQHGDNQITSALGYLIGDVSGLLACLFLLMYGFRFARLIGSDKLN